MEVKNNIEKNNSEELCKFCKSKLNEQAKICAVCGRSQNLHTDLFFNSFLPSGIIAFIVTLVTFYFIQKPHDETINLTTQKYAHYNAVVNKQMEYIEKIISDRQHALVLLDRLVREDNFVQTQKLLTEMKNLIKSTQINNTSSLIYLYQPIYDVILKFDSLLRETIKEIISPNNSTINLSEKRNILGKKLDEIISVSRGYFLSDSIYFSIRNQVLNIE